MSYTITIEDIVAKTPELPSIPAAAVRVIRETQSSTANAASIAQILATDQALSARVLRLANSAYYGLERKVTSLSESVVILGMRSVKNLAAVASTYSWMKRPLTGYCLGPEAMWHHAFGTAVGGQLVAQKSRKAEADVVFTAGLLHDIGKTALSIWIENKIGAILLYADREVITFDAAERKVLGYDHGQVGAHLAQCWNLPEEIEFAALYHHRPSQATDYQPIVDCVHIGEYLTTAMGFGLGGDGMHYQFDADSLKRLGLRDEDLDSLTDDFVVGYEAYESMFQELKVA